MNSRNAWMLRVQDSLFKIHHIGSTAVKGLSAKLTIDIAIEVKEFKDGISCVPLLQKLDYDYKGINILPDRHYFSKGEPRTHQIHMYQTGKQYLLEQLQFRDYLRGNPETRTEYNQLKQRLASLYKTDKHKYAEEKTEFVSGVLKDYERKKDIEP